MVNQNHPPNSSPALTEFARDMTIAQLSPVTIQKRLELLDRLSRHLAGIALIDATAADLRDFQGTFAHLAPSSVDIYTRHVRAFYYWAYARRLISDNVAEGLIMPRVRRGLPHPATRDSLRTVFACATGTLRMVYVLAAFAGLRRGEICRLKRTDLSLVGARATALILGKGRRERKVPLLGPVVDELSFYGLPRTGWVIRHNGKPYNPERLSVDSHNFLAGIGVETTLHSMRHSFATDVGRATKDPMFVRDILGHDSVATTEIYMDTDLEGAHEKLAGYSAAINEVLGRPALRVVGG
jgi:integrase